MKNRSLYVINGGLSKKSAVKPKALDTEAGTDSVFYGAKEFAVDFRRNFQRAYFRNNMRYITKFLRSCTSKLTRITTANMQRKVQTNAIIGVIRVKEILREIGMIDRCFESISNIEFKDYDLAKGQYIYLMRICENPGIIQERITDMLKVDRSTASRAIEKLRISGFIEKISRADNKKNICLYATEKGKEVYQLLKTEEEYSNAVVLKDISSDEIELLLNLLRRIRKNIEPDWELVKSGGKRPYPR